MQSRAKTISLLTLGGTICAFATPALAVVLLRTDIRNTSEPGSLSNRDPWSGPGGSGDPSSLLGSGWQWEGTLDNGYLATAIAPNYIISAVHIGLAGNFSFQGQNYPIVSSTQLPNSDLRVFQVSGTLQTYAPLWNESVDGSEVGKQLVVIGKGTQRGDPVTVGGVLKGWQFGINDGVQSWGTNVVTSIADGTSQNLGDFLYYTFDEDGGVNEAALSTGDSGGGVFIKSASGWKLAGINYGVDSPWSTDGTNGFNADIFDSRGLYAQDSNGVYQQIDPNGPLVAGGSYSSMISYNFDNIAIATGNTASTVPESTTLTLLPLTSLFSRRRRHQKTAIS